MAYRLLLVEDHRIVREGIKTILQQYEDFRIVGEADNGIDAVRLCRELSPDIILLDLGLPGMNGLEVTAEIRRHNPLTRILVLSMYDDEISVVRAIQSGARAFVLKRASASDLQDALRTVARGGSYLSPQVSDRLLARLQRGEPEPRAQQEALSLLTPRELQVLRLVADGKTSKEIAEILHLGLQTVRSYRKTMMKKLGVNNIASLTQLALAHGLTRPFPPNGKNPQN